MPGDCGRGRGCCERDKSLSSIVGNKTEHIKHQKQTDSRARMCWAVTWLGGAGSGDWMAVPWLFIWSFPPSARCVLTDLIKKQTH